ncbi:hypothetical protein D9M71_826230 [compost metagenome]
MYRGTENDAILLTLRNGIIPEKDFDQTFEKGNPDYRTPWVFMYKSIKYDVNNGTIAGKFTPGHGKINATVTMNLTNGSTVSGELEIYNSNTPNSRQPHQPNKKKH